MSDIVTRLRRWTHAVDAAPASDLMDEAADEIERLRLTDDERAAIDEVAANEAASASRSATRAIALRRLLWRTRNGSPEVSETVQ